MVAYTDHSENHFLSPSALLPFSQPFLSPFSAFFQPFLPFLSTFLDVKHPNPSDTQCLLTSQRAYRYTILISPALQKWVTCMQYVSMCVLCVL